MQKKFNGILIHSKVFKDNDLLIKFLSEKHDLIVIDGGYNKGKWSEYPLPVPNEDHRLGMPEAE